MVYISAKKVNWEYSFLKKAEKNLILVFQTFTISEI